MQKLNDGFYTQPYTSNIVAIRNNIAYEVAIINGKKLISNNIVPSVPYILHTWIFTPFVNN